MVHPRPEHDDYEDYHDAHGEDLGDHGHHWHPDGPDTADTARRFAFLDQLRQSRRQSDSEGDDSLDMGSVEGDISIPLHLDPEFADAAPGTLQDPGSGRKRRRVAERLDYITPEDFDEGSERDAFKLVYGYAVMLFGTNATPKSRAQAIEFFFCESPDAIGFQDAAMAISPTIRTDVVLLRFQYEFWRRYDVFAEPFPFISASPVPPRVVNAALYAGKDIGMLAARNMWLQPGVHIGQLVEDVSIELEQESEEGRNKILQVINRMTDEYLFSRKGDSMYVTLRNPELQTQDWADTRRADASRNQIWWSRLF